MNGSIKRAIAIRWLAGAVLTWSFNDEQIVSFAKILAGDKRFSEDLSKAILSALDANAHEMEKAFSSPRGAVSKEKDEDFLVEEIVGWVQREGLTKKQFIEFLLKKRALKVSPSTLQGESIRKIVYRVLDSAASKALDSIMKEVWADASSDPYLVAIEGRR